MPATGSFASLADGSYLAGLRPDQLELAEHTSGALEFSAKVQVTEVTGSETFVHLDHLGDSRVGLVHRIRNLEIGSTVPVFLDPKHVYIFAADGMSVAPASYAKAA